MMMRGRSAALLFCFVLLVPLIAACTGQPTSEANVQATVAAGIAATDTARQAEANLRSTIEAEVRATAVAAQPSPTTAAAAAATPGAGQAAAPGRTGSPTAASPANPTVGPGGPLATTTPAVAGTAPAASGTAPAGTPAAGTSGDTTVPTTFRPEGGEAARQTVNIQLVFDASGSMAEQIGSETRIEAARKAIQQVIDKLPDDAGDKLNVGFRVFGHQGDNTQAGRAASCQSTELLVPVQGVNKDVLRQQALSWEPTGWTPITLALQKAGESMPPASENVRNVIILVTDGEETCDGDPCSAAKALRESGAEVRVDVVGFGLTPQVADTLKCVAENSGGLYVDAKDGPSLAQTLESLIDLNKGGVLYIKAVGPGGRTETGAYVSEILDAQGRKINDSLGAAALPQKVDGSLDDTTQFADGESVYRLPAGTYTMKVGFLQQTDVRGTFDAPDSASIYTVVIGDGQQTDAFIGIGSVTVAPNGVPDETHCTLSIEVFNNGTWESVVNAFPSAPPCSKDERFGFIFNKTYNLLPGRYRLQQYETNRNGPSTTINEFTVEPGKAVTLQVGGR